MNITSARIIVIRMMMWFWGYLYRRVEYEWVRWRIKLYILDKKGSMFSDSSWYKPSKYEPTEFFK